MAREQGGRRYGVALDRAVRGWPLLLAVVLVGPLMVRGGHPLARDLVFVPRQPLNDAALGLGDGSPRAVPLDALVSVLTAAVDGGVLARVVLPLTLALAGWGVAALVRPLGRTAQVGAATFAVWNAYVVERLALGQWALLLAYAALPWVVAAASRYRREGRTRDAAAAIAWAGLASLTPTGGLLALAGLVVFGLGGRRRALVLLLGGMLLQAPWVVAAVTGPGARTSDPAGVAAFAPDTEGPAGVWVAILGGGGIWDAGAEPATRETWFAAVAAAAVLLVLAVGRPLLREAWGRSDLVRAVVLAGSLAVVALVAATPSGQDLLERVVAGVPGAGLLRDTQKLLAPAVVLTAVASGAAAARVVRRLAGSAHEVRVAAILPVVLAPFVLLPDATTVTWPTVDPVRLPAAFDDVAAALATEDDALVATLPWRSYRRFDWAGHGLTSSDPAVRLLEADVVTSDALQVGTTLVAGESRLAEQVGLALGEPSPAGALAALGVSHVLLYPDDPAAGEVDLAGLEPVVSDATMVLYRVPGAVDRGADAPVRHALVVGAHVAALVVWAAALATTTRRKRTVTSR